MIDCKLLHIDNSPVTLKDLGGISEAIGCLFPITDRKNVGKEESNYFKIRVTHELNDHTFHTYYGFKSTSISLPEEYQKEIKKTFKNLAQLKLGKN